MIRLIIADDETLVRQALATVLDLDDRISVIGQASNGHEALQLLEELRPSVALVDLQMPDLDGIDVTARARTVSPATKVIIVTSHGRPGHLRRALASGAAGFVPKTTPARALTEIIGQVAAGHRYVDPELSAEAIAAGDTPLTPRESDVLELAASGAPLDEIARRAHLSPGTVRNYLSSATIKLGATNRHEAARVARSRGWI